MIQHDHSTTRFSRSVGIAMKESKKHGLLIRIHPVVGIEEPAVLSEASILLGRDTQCQLVLPDDSVSRKHALIEQRNGEYFVSDLRSLNGTYVNENRVSGEVPLHAGDRVRFGNQIFKYLSADGVEAQYHEVVFKMMTSDGLTGVHNRRYLTETLDREWVQAKRSGSPLCFLLIDLDRFKSINDSLGHLAGDAVLVEFANRARTTLRGGDLLARYGGEEFCILLARTELRVAAEIAERVRLCIAESPVMFEDKSIPVTASVGIACDQEERVLTQDDLVALADARLYSAKSAGRNRICF